MEEKFNSNLLETYFLDGGWSISHREERSAKAAEYFPFDDLGLTPTSIQSLRSFDRGIYRHQREGILRYQSGANLAVTTSTASGKTLIFNVCALEELSRVSNSRIVAIYPLKALATEQAIRWEHLVKQAGIVAKVGRIDGGIPTQDRPRILKESRILVMTPDIIHAWLFSSISSTAVLQFLKNISLVIVDEAHSYSGVFGSNSAFLFGRLLHASQKLGGHFRYIASSATMQDPEVHLAKLTGEQFEVIGPEYDTSPRAALSTLLVNPPKPKDMLTAVSDLVSFAAMRTEHQSITFVDSRKQTEYLASIIDRQMAEEVEESNAVDYDRLKDLQIYPYRSGYEEEDRQRIQTKLAKGTLRGVVSTSALEMGIDLPHLSLGVLFGMPRSATSYYQRIGRVGRRKDGTVVVVNNGSVVTESIFREPKRIKNLPLVQSALYLHNHRIQYIHAMCLARRGGEDEAVCESLGIEKDKFSSPTALPVDFINLCQAERVGEVSSELQSMKAQAGDDPYHTFPLRDLDFQFKVEYRQGPNINNLGSLSQSQLMREAYPGAVYYYQTRPYRVVRIRKQQRLVEVRPEKRYFTSPLFLPTLILPNLVGDSVFQSRRYGELVVIECGLQVGEAVIGFKERRGNNELVIKYPLDATLGLFHDSPKFSRYSFTSGVIFTHPALGREQVKCGSIADIIDEAFLMSLPFERQDISAGADRHRATRDAVKQGERFVCVYDQTYGSLRLTSHLIKNEVIRDVFARARDIAVNDSNISLNRETIEALEEMADSVALEPEDLGGAGGPLGGGDQFAHVILPGSIGINLQKDNEEFEVEAVFFSSPLGRLAYRGKHLSEKKKAEQETWRHSATTVAVPVDHIQPLEGESKMGWYNLETGELLNQLPAAGEF